MLILNTAGISPASGHFLEFQSCPEIHLQESFLPPTRLADSGSDATGKLGQKAGNYEVDRLNDSDTSWAACVFINAMTVQKESVKEVVARCNHLSIKIVAGGPLFTAGFEEFNGIDHFVLGEAEVTLPPFLEDLDKERARRIYASIDRSDISTTLSRCGH